jgi:DNA-binding ferritin-like protein (Dps family)
MATGWIKQKRRYRQYKARTKQLPATYHTAIDALERYLLIFGPGKGDSVLLILADLADLFEQSAANRTPIREVVGEDPVEFTEAFLRNYPEVGWITREREPLTNAIERAAGPGRVGRVPWTFPVKRWHQRFLGCPPTSRTPADAPKPKRGKRRQHREDEPWRSRGSSGPR